MGNLLVHFGFGLGWWYRKGVIWVGLIFAGALQFYVQSAYHGTMTFPVMFIFEWFRYGVGLFTDLALVYFAKSSNRTKPFPSYLDWPTGIISHRNIGLVE